MSNDSHYQIYNTLLVDKNHRSPATAHAASNIVRCALAAVIVAFQQNLFDVIGIGWTFTFMGGLAGVIMGLLAVDHSLGTKWRQESLAKNPEV
jgi:hypothetical protein